MHKVAQSGPKPPKFYSQLATLLEVTGRIGLASFVVTMVFAFYYPIG